MFGIARARIRRRLYIIRTSVPIRIRNNTRAIWLTPVVIVWDSPPPPPPPPPLNAPQIIDAQMRMRGRRERIEGEIEHYIHLIMTILLSIPIRHAVGNLQTQWLLLLYGTVSTSVASLSLLLRQCAHWLSSTVSRFPLAGTVMVLGMVVPTISTGVPRCHPVARHLSSICTVKSPSLPSGLLAQGKPTLKSAQLRKTTMERYRKVSGVLPATVQVIWKSRISKTGWAAPPSPDPRRAIGMTPILEWPVVLPNSLSVMRGQSF